MTAVPEKTGASSEPADSPSIGELERLYKISREILSRLEFDQLLPCILDLALQHTGIERGILFYFDPETGQVHPWAVRGVNGSEVAEAEAYSRTIVEHARAARDVIASDAQADPVLGRIDSIDLQGIRSVICLPILGESRVLGALYLDDRRSEHVLNEATARFARILANLVGSAVENAERFRLVARQREALQQQLQRFTMFDEIIGRSEPMAALLASVERVAPTDFPVLIIGESGAGKELVARAIHRASARPDGPFIVQNCAAMPGELLESELFGHIRGAFTGAVADRAGLFRRAHRGTLFLDEVAELDIRLQAKLLRVLEDGLVRPVGSEESVLVDVRVISATSAAVERAVDEQRMRRDLYYRLNVMSLRLPPLRSHPEDIPLLVDHFLRKHRDRAGGSTLQFSRDVLAVLRLHPWPGNIRELEHFVMRALVLSRSSELGLTEARELLGLSGEGLELPLHAGNPRTLRQVEEAAIRDAMLRASGNKARAAAILGIDRNALHRRLVRMREDGGLGD